MGLGRAARSGWVAAAAFTQLRVDDVGPRPLHRRHAIPLLVLAALPLILAGCLQPHRPAAGSLGRGGGRQSADHAQLAPCRHAHLDTGDAQYRLRNQGFCRDHVLLVEVQLAREVHRLLELVRADEELGTEAELPIALPLLQRLPAFIQRHPLDERLAELLRVAAEVQQVDALSATLNLRVLRGPQGQLQLERTQLRVVPLQPRDLPAQALDDRRQRLVLLAQRRQGARVRVPQQLVLHAGVHVQGVAHLKGRDAG